MKKITDFLKWPWSIPMTILLLSYICWFLFYPMEFKAEYDDNYSAFISGIILISIFSFFVIILRLVKNYKIIFTLVFIFYFTALGASSIYTLMYFPSMGEKAELGNFKYYVVGTSDSDWHGRDIFYKCKKWTFDCSGLYNSGGLTGTKIIVDKQHNEVSLFEVGFQRLLVTDGESPRIYTGLSARFQEYTYQLSDKCNNFNNNGGYYHCESNTYILYQCNLGYTSCIQLPIQYTSSYGEYFNIVPDETNETINVYIDYDGDTETLIFTYGERPRCYVEGCEILGQ